MIILRQKIYSDPSTWKTIKEAIKFGGIMGFGGGISGALIGDKFGGARGAIIGALAAGIPIGVVSAIFSYKTDRDSIEFNKSLREKEIDYKKQFAEKAVENPTKLFTTLSFANERINLYKNLSKKSGFEFPSEFYKFIKLQKDFIPVAAKWVKDNGGKDSDEWTRIILTLSNFGGKDNYSEFSADFVENLFSGENPEYQTISFCPSSGKFGYSVQLPEECQDTLKNAILCSISDGLGGESKEIKSLAKLYENFIKTRL